MNKQSTARALVAARSGGDCEIALAGTCQGAATTVHHRRKRGRGYDWDPANLLAACGSGTTGCHGWVEAHPAKARFYGWWIFTGDGAPQTVPVLLRTYGETKRLVVLGNDGTWVAWPDHVTAEAQGSPS